MNHPELEPIEIPSGEPVAEGVADGDGRAAVQGRQFADDRLALHEIDWPPVVGVHQ